MKKLLSAILAAGIVFGAAVPTAVNPHDYAVLANAADEYTEGTYDVLTYRNFGNYIEISDCDEAAGKVVIPSEIDGLPVTSIDYDAFNDHLVLNSIIIEYTEGFYDVLKYKNYLDYVEIYDCNESAKEAAIPSEIGGVPVKNIGDEAFNGCSGLTAVIILDSVTSIGEHAFQDFTGTIYGVADSYVQTYAEENGIKFSVIGDVDGDGTINSSDASLVLREYALIATGEALTFSEAQKIIADVNMDKVADSSDASVILAYYAYTATGGTDNIFTFMKK